MFRKILIANRGEIACRIAKTAKRLGINTVGIYSNIDSNSKHVQMCDNAFYVGENKSTESYLKMHKIIEIAKNSGAEAIHPGYGFLSENSEFVKLCEQNKIKFIGPPLGAIQAMGSKIESKKIMENAKVPIVPGYFGENQDKDFLIETARKIQYPIMIKADLGGGGKGMRIVHNENEFYEALQSAQSEASKSFGSAKILMEKYIANSKHIEVQVFGDNHGNYVYLFERDCTIQRRHQKVIEEAPSYLSEDLRHNLCSTAVMAAKAVGYVNAGTVEFIFDVDRNQFYFMEMNTRLQVEHPITEMITREDLVEWQLLIAAGEKLPKKQEEIKRYGHAMEARIYSEDPYNNFLPGSGKILYLHEPNHRYSESNLDIDVRVETGIRQGDEVSVFYDPMISKLVCWAPTRDLCINKISRALEEYKILGLPTNTKFIQTILSHPEFKKWDFDTNFIAKHKEELLSKSAEPSDSYDALVTVMSKIINEGKNQLGNKSNGPWGINDNFRINYSNVRVFRMEERNRKFVAHVTYHGENSFKVKIVHDTKESVYDKVTVNATGSYDIIVNVENHSVNKFKYYTDNNNNIRVLKNDGSITHIDFVPENFGISDESSVKGNKTVKAPMPCTVSKIFVQVGQTVKKGDNLISLEAMKMEHLINAGGDGKIKRILTGEGKFSDAGAVLIEFEE